MWINVDPTVDTSGLLSQIKTVKELTRELESALYKLEKTVRDIRLDKKNTPVGRVEPCDRCKMD